MSVATNASMTGIATPTPFANPSSLAALSFINGVSTSAMRADAAPAIDTTINPVWTGSHTFSPGTGVGVVVNTVPGSNGLNVIGTSPGSHVSTAIVNSSAAAASDARCIVSVNGGSGGNPYFLFDVAGVADWFVGVDNADSDKFKYSYNAALGGAGDIVAWHPTTGQQALLAPGAGISIKEGSNCKQGRATLVGGTVVVSNTSITATSIVHLTTQSLGTVAVPSALCVSARNPGADFTILASAPTDTSVVGYDIFEAS